MHSEEIQSFDTTDELGYDEKIRSILDEIPAAEKALCLLSEEREAKVLKDLQSILMCFNINLAGGRLFPFKLEIDSPISKEATKLIQNKGYIIELANRVSNTTTYLGSNPNIVYYICA